MNIPPKSLGDKRKAAAIIDFSICLLGPAAFLLINGNAPVTQLTGWPVLLFSPVYFLCADSALGAASFGKKLMGLRVVSQDGQRNASPFHSFIRNGLYCLGWIVCSAIVLLISAVLSPKIGGTVGAAAIISLLVSFWVMLGEEDGSAVDRISRTRIAARGTSPSPPQADSMFVHDAGETKGPFTWQQIKTMWSKGDLSAETLVYESDSWQSLREKMET